MRLSINLYLIKNGCVKKTRIGFIGGKSHGEKIETNDLKTPFLHS
jgi:hypothetical protein